MWPYLAGHVGNPSSAHAAGQLAREAVARAREQVAALIGAEPASIVFTSGGTESDNLAVFGSPAGPVVCSPFEHPAVAEPVRRRGDAVHALAVGPDGRVVVPRALPPHALCTVMLAQNETGAVQPVAALAALARAVGALVHTDAAQAVGKIPVHVGELGVDLLTIAGHKLGAPAGVGALYVRPGVQLAPRTFGGGHEGGLRPGTENVASIVALGEACAVAAERLPALGVTRQRELLFAALSARIPDLRRTIPPEHALPNTLHVRFPDVVGGALLAACPAVTASAGSACHAGDPRPSPTLLQMGLADDDAVGAVRLSLGFDHADDELLRAAHDLADAWARLVG
jgi:cysteine desulfurase